MHIRGLKNNSKKNLNPLILNLTAFWIAFKFFFYIPYLNAVLVTHRNSQSQASRRDATWTSTACYAGGAYVAQWETRVLIKLFWNWGGIANAAPEAIAAWKTRVVMLLYTTKKTTTHNPTYTSWLSGVLTKVCVVTAFEEVTVPLGHGICHWLLNLSTHKQPVIKF